MKQTVRLTESELRNIISEAVKKTLNEIGDTPRGNFALNAVRGRRAAKGYYKNMGAKEKEENNRTMNMADDKMFKNYRKNPKLDYTNQIGYEYGFDKGVDKYKNN